MRFDPGAVVIALVDVKQYWTGGIISTEDLNANQLVAAGFYFTNLSDVVRCFFCGVQVCHWSEGDDALKEHQCWSPCCGFVKGLCVGNIPILSNDQPEKSPQQPMRSRDVCGPHFKLGPNSLSERSKYYYLYFFVTFVPFITPH